MNAKKKSKDGKKALDMCANGEQVWWMIESAREASTLEGAVANGKARGGEAVL